MICPLIDSSEVAPAIFKLQLKYLPSIASNIPIPGTIYRLKPTTSSLLFPRTFSLWNVQKDDSGVILTFLMQVKGRGTEELAGLKARDALNIEGAIGNSYPLPEKGKKILIISGGIGIASAGGFAHSLGGVVDYDFIACFKSSSYGLETIESQADKLTVLTEDATKAVSGTARALPDEIPAGNAKEALAEYAAVYACGPEAMLEYVQKLCAAASKPCFLSAEANIACGIGACLGCSIRTTDGNKRVCVDGPVFAGEKLLFPLTGKREINQHLPKYEAPQRLAAQDDAAKDAGMSKLSIYICGVHFQTPLILASGTAGYGGEYGGIIDFSNVGGICSKGLTLNPRNGNTGVRLLETPSGLMNSIGLENPGIAHFIEKELEEMLSIQDKTGAVAIANLSGECEDDYLRGAELLEKTQIKFIEVNISCPNVRSGGMAFGLVPETAAALISKVRMATSKPLIVKLSPNAADIAAVADAVRKSGADAISLVNTFQALAIDIERAAPLFDNTFAGLSGPAIKPLALRIVYNTAKYMQSLPKAEQIPLIAIGGISSWRDAAEFLMAGADAFQVGSACMARPSIVQEIIAGLSAFMQRKGYANIKEMQMNI